MFRSVPVDKVSKKEVKDDKKEERDEFMILFDIPKVATNQFKVCSFFYTDVVLFLQIVEIQFK